MAKDYLELYRDHLISGSGMSTATGLTAMTDGSVSHDQITQFLTGGLFDSKQLWKQVKPGCGKFKEMMPASFSMIRLFKNSGQMRIRLSAGILIIQKAAILSHFLKFTESLKIGA